ncbi:hypothetical protein HW126_16770 [Salinispora sp. H7-4]|nr:hypothetical protein [Salinispora sp. H7-4]
MSAGLAVGALAVAVYFALSDAEVALVVLPFVVAAASSAGLTISAIRCWLRGEAIPTRFSLLSLALGLLGLNLSWIVGVDGVGAAFLSGFVFGLAVGNIQAVRMARANRGESVG